MVTVSLTPQGVGSPGQKASPLLAGLWDGEQDQLLVETGWRDTLLHLLSHREPPHTHGESPAKECPSAVLPGCILWHAHMSLKALQGGACLSVTLFYGLGVRHVWDSCGHWVTCSGVCCVCHCVQKAQHEPCWVWHGNRGLATHGVCLDVGMGCHGARGPESVQKPELL